VGAQVVVVSVRVSWLVWRVVVAWISSFRWGTLQCDAVSANKGRGLERARERTLDGKEVKRM
jgi:hypothetical protein